MATEGEDRGPVAKHINKEVNFSRFKNDVIRVVHHGDFLAVAQVILDAAQLYGCDELIAHFLGIIPTVIGVKKLMVVIGKP